VLFISQNPSEGERHQKSAGFDVHFPYQDENRRRFSHAHTPAETFKIFKMLTESVSLLPPFNMNRSFEFNKSCGSAAAKDQATFVHVRPDCIN
jgi:hypothetical protein